MGDRSKDKARKHTPKGQEYARSAAQEFAEANLESNAASNPDSGWESPQAANYAASISAKIPGYANLYEMGARLLRAALSLRAAEASAEAEDRKKRILIVGAGGGQELETFGGAEPDWRFVGFDPSAVMLEQARLRIRGTDIESRTLLVQGAFGVPDRQRSGESSSSAKESSALLRPTRSVSARSESDEGAHKKPAAYGSGKQDAASLLAASPMPAGRLEDSEAAYDGAACMLVLHFVRGIEAKKKLLCAIAERLKPGSPLLIASLNADFSSPAYPAIMEAWRLHMQAEGVPEKEWLRFAASLGPQSDPMPAAEVESLLRECGFVRPQRYFGAFLIDGWLTFRNGGSVK